MTETPTVTIRTHNTGIFEIFDIAEWIVFV